MTRTARGARFLENTFTQKNDFLKIFEFLSGRDCTLRLICIIHSLNPSLKASSENCQIFALSLITQVFPYFFRYPHLIYSFKGICIKPNETNHVEIWREGMADLAACSNVAVKISGLPMV